MTGSLDLLQLTLKLVVLMIPSEEPNLYIFVTTYKKLTKVEFT